MLADMGCNDLAVVGIGVGEDVLNEIIAILVASNIDERNTGTISSAFTDAVKISAQKLWASNLETLLDHLRGKLVHTILGSIADDVIDRTAAISRGAMLTNVLNTPIAELSMRDDIDVRQNFLDARAL